MSEISVSGRTKVKTFYNQFISEFPYLHASLRYPDGKAVDPEASVANARSKSVSEGYSPTEGADLSVRGNLNVGTFEKRFKENFSIECEIHFKKNGKWVATKKKYDSLTLNEANSKLKEEGADLIEKF